MKSKSYLNFVGGYPCCITGGTQNVDLHHESLVPGYSGASKNKFDFGVIPLDHTLHLEERHTMGKDSFWEMYELNPVEIAIGMVKSYIDTWPEDVVMAEEALEMLESVR